jgi:asparagine synthase (glutamine-hydrolysing)
MAKQNVTVALSGDGGDESFGGYTFRYIPHMLECKVRSALPQAFRGAVFGTLGKVWPGSALLPKPLRFKTILENLAVSDGEAFYNDLIWLRSDTRENLYSNDFMNALRGFTPMETVSRIYANGNASDPLGRSQYTDIHFYMTDDVLVKVDRMSMAHSLEVRSPLLDYRVIEFAARLPTNLKVNSRIGKLLLRELTSRRLPLGTHNKPKKGFSIPAKQWLRSELKARAESTIFEKSFLLTTLIERTMLRRIWEEHQSGSRDHSVLLWGFMMLGIWEQHQRNSIR